MARTDVPVHQAQRTGTVLAAAVAGDAVNGHVVSNDGATALLVANTGETVARTVTFNLFRTVDGQVVTPREEDVAVGETQFFGPFQVSDYGTMLNVDVDHAELTLRAVHI